MDIVLKINAYASQNMGEYFVKKKLKMKKLLIAKKFAQQVVQKNAKAAIQNAFYNVSLIAKIGVKELKPI